MAQPQIFRDLQEAQLRTACQEALEEVLETMFFELPVDGLSFSTPPAEEEPIAVARFEGSLTGSLSVAVSAAVIGPLAAGFLGREADELGPEDLGNMLMEIANMLCGATMSRLEPRGRLRIAQPVVVAGEERAAVLQQSPWLRFPMTDGHLLVCVQYGES